MGEFIQGIHFLFVVLEGKEWKNNARSQLTRDSNSDIHCSVILLEGPLWVIRREGVSCIYSVF